MSNDFRVFVRDEFLRLAKLAEDAREQGEIHHCWIKALAEQRAALRDAFRVHQELDQERELEDLRTLRDELAEIRDELHGGPAQYVEPPTETVQ